jgi:hypothetical protein
MTRNALVALLALLCAGCRYANRFPAPEGVDTVAIEVFNNRTLYRDLEYELQRALRREVTAKTPLTLGLPDTADAVLSGEILDYRRQVLRESRADRPTEYRIVLVVAYELTDRRTGTTLASTRQLHRAADYQLHQGQLESDAREEAIRELARELVQHAFHPWN